ncbi:DMT family transporter [Haliea sp. AH-315-K21]|nr:DMT family transporter [Haliea sp. AH-315-K21]MBN4075645.1 DMT family transporter [Gammaproteobacteria bacterium AH-315-E17]
MHNSNQKHVAGFFLSLTAAFLWGVVPIALKELLAGMDATTIVWFRFLVSGLVLLLWLTISKKLPNKLNFNKQTILFLLLASLALSCNYFFFSYSLYFVNGETSEAVIQLSTLFLILGGVIIYKEAFVPIQKIGVCLIALGLLLFFNARLKEFLHFGNSETIGVIMLVIAAFTWTLYALLQKQLLVKFSSAQILLLIYLFSVLLLLPFASPLSVFQLTQQQLFLLLFCCLNTLVAYGCFAEALNCWDASKVSAVLTLAPLFTIGFLKLLVVFYPAYQFTDRLGFISILGALLLVIGSILTALMPSFKNVRRKGSSIVS